MIFASASDDEAEAVAAAGFGAKGFSTVEVGVDFVVKTLVEAVAGLGEKRLGVVDPSLGAKGFEGEFPNVLPGAEAGLGTKRLEASVLVPEENRLEDI